jgi:hypothetical protein
MGGNNNRLFITSAGLVGIGTSVPEGAYLTLGHSRGTTWELLQNNDTLGRIDFVAGDGVDDVHAGEIRCAVDGTPGSNDMPTRLVFSTTADGAASPTERLRITSAGNVGIGTTGPAAALHVVAGGTAAYFISNASSAGVSIGSDTNLGKIGTNGSTCNLAFNIDGAEKARIDTSGRFLVGTSTAAATYVSLTADGASSPTERFRISS